MVQGVYLTFSCAETTWSPKLFSSVFVAVTQTHWREGLPWGCPSGMGSRPQLDWGEGGVWRGGLPSHTLPPPSVAPHWQDMESAGPSLSLSGHQQAVASLTSSTAYSPREASGPRTLPPPCW